MCNYSLVESASTQSLLCCCEPDSREKFAGHPKMKLHIVRELSVSKGGGAPLKCWQSADRLHSQGFWLGGYFC